MAHPSLSRMKPQRLWPRPAPCPLRAFGLFGHTGKRFSAKDRTDCDTAKGSSKVLWRAWKKEMLKGSG